MLRYLYEFDLLNPDGSLADQWEQKNIIPQNGVTYFAQAMFGDTTPIGTFYFGMFQNNFVPDSNTVAADLPTVAGEFLGYNEATRPLWNRVFDGVGAISNSAARAELTCNVDQRVYGGFLVSNSAKGSNTGTLISIARFQTPRDVVAGQVIRARLTLNLIPAEVV
jgi:hypothetical protein